MEADDEFDRWLAVDEDDLEVVFEAKSELSAETREKYGRALQKFVVPRLGQSRVSDLTLFQLCELMVSLAKAGEPVETGELVASALRSMLCEAVDDGCADYLVAMQALLPLSMWFDCLSASDRARLVAEWGGPR